MPRFVVSFTVFTRTDIDHLVDLHQAPRSPLGIFQMEILTTMEERNYTVHGLTLSVLLSIDKREYPSKLHTMQDHHQYIREAKGTEN